MARILISLPHDLLTRIDDEVRARGGSRSGFLQETAERQLGWPTVADLDAALRRGRDALTDAGRSETAELIHEQRMARDADDRRR